MPRGMLNVRHNEGSTRLGVKCSKTQGLYTTEGVGKEMKGENQGLCMACGQNGRPST